MDGRLLGLLGHTLEAVCLQGASALVYLWQLYRTGFCMCGGVGLCVLLSGELEDDAG